MPFPPNHWFHQVKTRNAWRMSTMLSVLEERLLPCFDNVEAEADRKAEEQWQAMSEMPWGENGPFIDEGDAAEMARDAGLTHYQAITSARQTILNSFAIALFHLWEQQVLAFHRRQFLHPKEDSDHRLFSVSEFSRRLAGAGVQLEQFRCWPELRVFRLLANTIKHADGSAANRLKELRPLWFEAPCLRDLGFDPTVPKLRRVYEPLGGDEVFVDVSDIRLLVKSANDFWDELFTALEAAGDSSNRTLA